MALMLCYQSGLLVDGWFFSTGSDAHHPQSFGRTCRSNMALTDRMDDKWWLQVKGPSVPVKGEKKLRWALMAMTEFLCVLRFHVWSISRYFM